jgi:hypothetical protein
MALKKAIELANGVVVNYHRVTSLDIITNVQNIIEVSSYTSEAKRLEEKAALENGAPADVFVSTTILSAPYEQTATIEQVYEYLKTLPEYEGAENV